MAKKLARPPRKTAIVALRLDPELKAAAQIAAAADDRTLSQWIAALIRKTLAKPGRK